VAMMLKKTGKLSACFFVLGIITFMSSSSCDEDLTGSDRIGVVVSILPLADFVEQVGGDKIGVTVMVPPGASPHAYEPKPDQLKKVNLAKMFVMVGSGVEFELVWMNKLVGINKEMMVVNSSQGIELQGRDPHVWLSPKNAQKMVGNICDALIELDPKNQEFYKANFKQYLRELVELDAYIRERFEDIEDRRFIIYHPAWIYFAREYELEQIPVERAGKEVTAEEMKKVVKIAQELENKIVFVSPQFPTKGAETIAKEIDGKTMFIDPLPRTYIANMQTVVERLVEAMR
jgi:zinc transport system substrate-binding protein